MKRVYASPELELVRFTTNDVIATSYIEDMTEEFNTIGTEEVIDGDLDL